MTDQEMAQHPADNQADLPDWLAEVTGEKVAAEPQAVPQRFSTFNIVAGLIIITLLG